MRCRGRTNSTRRVDIHGQRLVRRVGLQEQELRGDQRRRSVVYWAVDADDALAQQPAEDVKHALAATARGAASLSAPGAQSSACCALLRTRRSQSPWAQGCRRAHRAAAAAPGRACRATWRREGSENGDAGTAASRAVQFAKPCALLLRWCMAQLAAAGGAGSAPVGHWWDDASESPQLQVRRERSLEGPRSCCGACSALTRAPPRRRTASMTACPQPMASLPSLRWCAAAAPCAGTQKP